MDSVSTTKGASDQLTGPLTNLIADHTRQDIAAKNRTMLRLMAGVVRATDDYQNSSKALAASLFGRGQQASNFATRETRGFYGEARGFALWLSSLNEEKKMGLDEGQLKQWMTEFIGAAFTMNANGLPALSRSHKLNISMQLTG